MSVLSECACGVERRCVGGLGRGARSVLGGSFGIGRNFFVRVACGCLAGGVMVGGLVGCDQPLLSEREARTQYDRYDLSRDQLPAQYVEDEFGRREPNLRGRLLRR